MIRILQKVKEMLGEHKMAVAAFLVVGVTCSFFHVYFRVAHSDVYQGIGLPSPNSDESAYFMRIKEITDGYLTAAGYPTAIGKDAPYMYTFLSEMVIAFLGKVFGLDVVAAADLAGFIFPALSFAVLYVLLCHWLKCKGISLAISFAVILGVDLLNSKAPWNLFFNRRELWGSFLTFTRTCAPQIPFFLFALFLIAFWKFIVRGKRFWGALGGIALGLSFYSYPYTWSFIFAFLGCFGLISICRKKWGDLRKIVWVALLALIISIPYFWNLWEAMHHPVWAETSGRLAPIGGHAPQFGALSLFLLGSFLMFFPKKPRGRYFFILALVLAPQVALNQQIVTGVTMAPAHYHWYFHKPLFIIVLMMIVFEWLQQIERERIKKILRRTAIILTTAVCLFGAWSIQSLSYNLKKGRAIELNNRYGSVLTWLKTNADKDDVVLSGKPATYLVPMYTSLNSVTVDDAHYVLAIPEEQLLEMAFIEFKLNGLKAGEARDFFFENKVMISKRIYGQYYRRRGGYELIPDEKLEFITERYQKFLSFPLEQMLDKYEVEYLIWDMVLQPNWDVDRYDYFEKVYEMGDVIVYEKKQ